MIHTTSDNDMDKTDFVSNEAGILKVSVLANLKAIMIQMTMLIMHIANCIKLNIPNIIKEKERKKQRGRD